MLQSPPPAQGEGLEGADAHLVRCAFDCVPPQVLEGFQLGEQPPHPEPRRPSDTHLHVQSPCTATPLEGCEGDVGMNSPQSSDYARSCSSDTFDARRPKPQLNFRRRSTSAASSESGAGMAVQARRDSTARRTALALHAAEGRRRSKSDDGRRSTLGGPAPERPRSGSMDFGRKGAVAEDKKAMQAINQKVEAKKNLQV